VRCGYTPRAAVFFTNPSPLARNFHRAQALVEFSLVLPVVLLMTLGMIDLGRAFVFGVAVQEGTRQAVRVAASTNNPMNAATIANADVLGRLVAGSNPALTGCSASTGSQTCNGATWTFTVAVVGPSTATYNSVEAARAANDLTGGKITVTATGSVALLPGVSTGLYGLALPQIAVQGQSSMVIL
jgi:Flp pilus assembly protein TadG